MPSRTTCQDWPYSVLEWSSEGFVKGWFILPQAKHLLVEEARAKRMELLFRHMMQSDLKVDVAVESAYGKPHLFVRLEQLLVEAS